MIVTEDFEQAINILTALGDYKDSRDMLKDVIKQAEMERQYQEACSILDSTVFPSVTDMEEARNIFISLGDYKDCKDKLRHFKKVTLQEGYKSNNTVYYYNAWGDVSIECNYSNNIYSYRDPKLMITSPHNSDSRKIDPKWEMEFDENGNLIHEKISGSEYNYSYNSEGKIISCNNFLFWEYNDDGTLARCYSTTGNIERSYEYNTKGDLIHLYWYDSFFPKCYDEYYTYDESSNLIEVRTQYRSNDVSGSGTDTTNYTYDEFGNLIKKVQYHGRGSNFAEEYTYEYSEDRVTITSTIVGKPYTKDTHFYYYTYGYIWAPKYNDGSML